MSKKIIALLLVLCILLCTVACGNPKKKQGNKKPPVSSDVSSSDTVSTESDLVDEDVEEGEEVTIPQNTTSKVTSTYTVSQTGILNLNIDNSKVFNKNWNGINAIHQGFIFMPDEYGREYSDAQIEEELKRMGDMDINMVRSYMDAGYAFEKRSGKEVTYDWDNERMKGFYKWLDAMEERDIEVAVQMGWSIGSIGGATTQDSGGYKIPWYESGKLNIYSDMIKMYTDWVELFIKEVIIKRGYDIEHLVMFTEPYHFNEYTFFVAPGKKETKNGWEVTVDVIQATHKALKKAGLRDKVKLTGPQYGMSSKFFEGETLEEELKWWIDRIDECIDVYTFHWYIPTWPGNGSSSSSANLMDDNYDLWIYYFEEMVRIIGKTGKPFWFDEWMYGGSAEKLAREIQVQDFYPQQIAQTSIAAMNAGLNSALLWQLFEIVWPNSLQNNHEFIDGIHKLGTAPSLYESAIPYKYYYGFSLLAKYCGEKGSKVYSGEGERGVYCSMVEYKKNGKQYQNVIVVNTSSLEQKMSINFKKKIGKNMYRYLFDPIKIVPDTSAKMIPVDKGFKNVKTILQDTIPAASIVVYSTVKD